MKKLVLIFLFLFTFSLGNAAVFNPVCKEQKKIENSIEKVLVSEAIVAVERKEVFIPERKIYKEVKFNIPLKFINRYNLNLSDNLEIYKYTNRKFIKDNTEKNRTTNRTFIVNSIL